MPLIVVADEPPVLPPAAAAVLARIIRTHLAKQRSGKHVPEGQGLAIDRPAEPHSSS